VAPWGTSLGLGPHRIRLLTKGSVRNYATSPFKSKCDVGVNQLPRFCVEIISIYKCKSWTDLSSGINLQRISSLWFTNLEPIFTTRLITKLALAASLGRNRQNIELRNLYPSHSQDILPMSQQWRPISSHCTEHPEQSLLPEYP
jgi:hypothetical protein